MNIMVCDFSGGLGVYSYKVVNELNKLNEGKNFYLTVKENPYISYIDKGVILDCSLESFLAGHKRGSFLWACKRLMVALKNTFTRNRILRREKIDILSLQSCVPIIDSLFLKPVGSRTKIIITIHDVIPPIKSASFSNRSLKRLYNRADGLIVHSEENKQQIMELFNVSEKKIKFSNIGVYADNEILDRVSCKKKLDIPKEKFTILFFGMIREQKGLDILLQACKGIDCTLIIAGKMAYGETFDKYQKLIDKYRINAKTFVHYIENELVDVLYGACDVVALPYKYFYSQSGVFVESMKYKRALIGTDVSSFKSYISKYNIGLCCEPNSVEELARCIKELMENTSLQNEFEKNMEYALEDNSAQKCGRRYYDAFKAYLNEED